MGAPWLEGRDLAHRLNARGLPGVRALPFRFRPQFGKGAGQDLGGVYLAVTDAQALRPWTLGLHVLQSCRDAAPTRFAWRRQAYEFVHDRLAIDLLLGDQALREALEAGEDPQALDAACAAGRRAFREEAQAILCYGRW